MAFVCSGVILPAGSVPEGVTSVGLDAGMAYVPSPAKAAGSEAGLDHADWAASLSLELPEGTRAVYVEAEFFGGTGSQAAIGFEDGVARFGPVRTQTPSEDREGFAVVDGLDEMAINVVLRWLGVARTGTRDEFDSVGIARVCR